MIPIIPYLLRIVWLCIFPIGTVLLGGLTFIAVDQARETLAAFGDPTWRAAQSWWFVIAFVTWMVVAWYTTRLLLGRRFTPDLVGQCRSSRFAAALALWLPRALALAAAVPIIAVLWALDNTRPLAWVCGGLAILVLVGLVFRRRITRQVVARWRPDAASPDAIDTLYDFGRLSTAPRMAIALLFALSWAVFMALLLGMEASARTIGAPALVLLALMSWTLFGGLVLTYWWKSRGHVALTWLPGMLWLLASCFNENHPVAAGTHDAAYGQAAQAALAGRHTLIETFDAWVAQHPPGDPVIFVASAGGASRAAYWTVSALGLLEDEAQRHGERFAQNVFMLSGVSGGSVGAVAFSSALQALEGRKVPNDYSVRALGTGFAAQDHLAAVVGYALFPDLVQRFIPVPIDAFDRSRALEDVWTRDWARLLIQSGLPAADNPWAQPFLEVAAHPPYLVLNTATVGTGRRVLQAGFRLPLSDAYDLFEAPLETATLTAAGAAHNSARFAWVSPAGVVRNADRQRWDRLVDGGYIESTATLTVLEVLRELRAACRIQRTGGVCVPVAGEGPPVRVVLEEDVKVLVLDNTPTSDAGWYCGTALPRHASSISSTRGVAAALPLADVSAPMVAAYQTRTGRGAGAEFDLVRSVGGCAGNRYVELRLPQREDGPEPSMNWMLSARSREYMDLSLDAAWRGDPEGHAGLRTNLALARAWSSAH